MSTKWVDHRTQTEKLSGAREFMLWLVNEAGDTPEGVFVKLQKTIEREANGLNRTAHLEEFERYAEALDEIAGGAACTR